MFQTAPGRKAKRDGLFSIIRRGLRGRCPRCGEGSLFAGWNRLRERCPVCGLVYERSTGDTWFFMYVSTAGLTGVLVVLMFLLRPRILWVGQVAVFIAAIVVIGLTLPYRKGIAVAINYLTDSSARDEGRNEPPP